jgi:hypothetical protein
VMGGVQTVLKGTVSGGRRSAELTIQVDALDATALEHTDALTCCTASRDIGLHNLFLETSLFPEGQQWT